MKEGPRRPTNDFMRGTGGGAIVLYVSAHNEVKLIFHPSFELI